MTKYVVLARSKKDGMILDSYGCFANRRNAARRINELGYDKDIEYVYEIVDPIGTYANDEIEDEMYE